MTPVSREDSRTCALKSSFVNMTYIATRTFILTRGEVTAVTLTSWIGENLLRNSLGEAVNFFKRNNDKKKIEKKQNKNMSSGLHFTIPL